MLIFIEYSGGYLGGYFLKRFRLKTDSNGVDSNPTRFFSHFSFQNFFSSKESSLFSNCSKGPRDVSLSNRSYVLGLTWPTTPPPPSSPTLDLSSLVIKRVWMGVYKCQLSVKFWPFVSCQLKFKLFC